MCKSYIAVLFFILAVTQQLEAMSRGVPSPAPSPSAVAVATLASPLPAGIAPQLRVKTIRGVLAGETDMVLEGVDLANSVMKTECFKNQVLSAHYTENQGFTQSQIWARLILSPVVTNVEMYSGDFKANHINHTIGFETVPHDGFVHMNRHFVQTAFMVADNLIHEAEGHEQGFDHLGAKVTSEPYGMNQAFEACANSK